MKITESPEKYICYLNKIGNNEKLEMSFWFKLEKELLYGKGYLDAAIYYDYLLKENKLLKEFDCEGSIELDENKIKNIENKISSITYPIVLEIVDLFKEKIKIINDFNDLEKVENKLVKKCEENVKIEYIFTGNKFNNCFLISEKINIHLGDLFIKDVKKIEEKFGEL